MLCLNDRLFRPGGTRPPKPQSLLFVALAQNLG
jgi:hypothetical protein